MAAEFPINEGRKARKSKVPFEPSADKKANGDKANAQSAGEEKQSKVNFFQRLAQMTQDDWDRHRVYIYRRWPRVSKDGQPHYIGVHREALDEEAIKGLYGSGRFLCKLNNERRTLDEHGIEIMDLSAPPKLSVNELVDCAENEKYYKLWPAAAPKPVDGANAADGAVKELVGLLKTLVVDKGKSEPDDVKNTLIAWALQQAGKQSELNSPAAIANVITAIKDVLPNPAKESRGSEKSETLAIIAALKSLQTPPPPAPDPIQLLAAAKELFTPAQPAVDGLHQFREVFGFARELLGAGGGGRRSGWDIGLDYLNALTPTLGSPLAQALANIIALRSQPGGAPQTAPGVVPSVAPAAFDPYRDAARMREHSRNMNAQAPPPSPSAAAPSASAPPAAPPDNEIAALIQTYGGILLSAMNAAKPGYEFSEDISRVVGAGMVASVTSHGEQALADTMLQFPEFRVFGEARVRKFVHEFVDAETYLENLDDDEAQEDERASQRARA